MSVSVTKGKWGIVVMTVSWRQLCVSMIWEGLFICSDLGTGVPSDAGSVSSELLMCSGCVHSLLILFLVDMCLEAIDVCI